MLLVSLPLDFGGDPHGSGKLTEVMLVVVLTLVFKSVIVVKVLTVVIETVTVFIFLVRMVFLGFLFILLDRVNNLQLEVISVRYFPKQSNFFPTHELLEMVFMVAMLLENRDDIAHGKFAKVSIGASNH